LYNSTGVQFTDHLHLLLCQNESLLETIHVKLHFVCMFSFMQIKLIFKRKFLWGLVLKQRHKGTRKWPIMLTSLKLFFLIRVSLSFLYLSICFFVSSTSWPFARFQTIKNRIENDYLKINKIVLSSWKTKDTVREFFILGSVMRHPGKCFNQSVFMPLNRAPLC